MEKRKKSFTQVALPGLGDYFHDDGIDREPDVPLTLTLVGEGKSKIAQFIDLLRRMGLARAHRLCKKHGLWGIKKENQLLVDTQCGSRTSFYKREIENGVSYYIYANHDTPAKKEYLSKLSEAMQKEHAKQSPLPGPIGPQLKSPHRNTNFSVRFGDGVVVAEKTAKDTFVKAIAHMGPDRIAHLGLRVRRIPLVGRSRFKGRYASSIVEVKEGLFVITQSSTNEKIKLLHTMAQRLGVELTITTI